MVSLVETIISYLFVESVQFVYRIIRISSNLGISIFTLFKFIHVCNFFYAYWSKGLIVGLMVYTSVCQLIC